MANATDPVSVLGFFNLGNGLIEVAALTSLVGSAAAQSLALGDKGPAGLVWAMMTIFGAMSVVTLFTATATPGWLRDCVGVRSAKSDAVVGMSLDLNKSFRYRGRGEAAKAVECEIKIERRGKEQHDFPLEHERREVYAFDQLTANVLNSIPPCTPGEVLKVFSYVKDPWHRETASYQFWLDSILLGISVVAKTAEVFVLWTFGARMLAFITAASWLFFFISALFLHLHGLRKYRQGSEVDTLSGLLPTCSTPGGARKVLLGIRKSRRQHVFWRALWGLGAVVGVLTVIATYLALSWSTSAQIFLIWTGFQILWVAARSTIYYLLSDRDMQYLVSIEGKPWPKVGPQERARVCRLMMALSKYQQHLHPRSLLSYVDDVDATPNIPRKLSSHSVACDNHATTAVTITGVIGDTLLASAVWIWGSKKGGFDLYDSCVVIITTPDGEMAIPAARALSGKPLLHRTDSEWGVQTSHLPRGGLLPQGNRKLSNTEAVRWCYWIPYSNGRWLYFTTPQTIGRGTWQASISSDQQVTDQLARGELFISLKHVNEVKEVIENSTLAYNCLLELIS